MGACDWGKPAFMWLAISSYSPLKEHRWVRGIDFPFEVGLLPGYARPAALNTDDIVAICMREKSLSLWLSGTVNSQITCLR